jgi:hypothetical protein
MRFSLPRSLRERLFWFGSVRDHDLPPQKEYIRNTHRSLKKVRHSIMAVLSSDAAAR